MRFDAGFQDETPNALTKTVKNSDAFHPLFIAPWMLEIRTTTYPVTDLTPCKEFRHFPLLKRQKRSRNLSQTALTTHPVKHLKSVKNFDRGRSSSGCRAAKRFKTDSPLERSEGSQLACFKLKMNRTYAVME